MIFAEFFCALRKRLRLSQDEMAERLGVCQATVSRIEGGHTEPSGGALIRAYLIAENVALDLLERFLDAAKAHVASEGPQRH